MRKRLILADDHDLLLGGVTKLLEADFDIVARVSNGRTLIAECERLRPALIIVDIGMPELNGIEAARRISTLMYSGILFANEVSQPNKRGFAECKELLDLLRVLRMGLEKIEDIAQRLHRYRQAT